ncbi:hypothetical protein PMEGAPR185_51630 [Priestia megaterium]
MFLLYVLNHIRDEEQWNGDRSIVKISVFIIFPPFFINFTIIIERPKNTKNIYPETILTLRALSVPN